MKETQEIAAFSLFFVLFVHFVVLISKCLAAMETIVGVGRSTRGPVAVLPKWHGKCGKCDRFRAHHRRSRFTVIR